MCNKFMFTSTITQPDHCHRVQYVNWTRWQICTAIWCTCRIIYSLTCYPDRTHLVTLKHRAIRLKLKYYLFPV